MLALHRSITFWSGILVMTFIVWAWRDSMTQTRVIGRGQWDLVSSHAGLHFSTSFGHTTDWRVTSYPHSSRQLRIDEDWFPLPHYLRAEDLPEREGEKAIHHFASVRDLGIYHLQGEERGWACFVPYWLVLIAAGCSWLVLLLWRARRRRKGIPVDDIPNAQ